MDKPDVDFIEGLSPAVSIDQKSTNRNPRSTVGTITEVYDYLRLLFARAGRPHCPVCGEAITRQSPQQIVDRLLELPDRTRFQVLAPVVKGRKGEYVDLFAELQTKGFSRARVDGEVVVADRAAAAGEEAQAHHRGRRRPARGQGRRRRRQAAADRLRRDRAQPRRRRAARRVRRRRPGRPGRRRGSAGSPRRWPAPTTTRSPSTRSSRGRSRSTRPTAPARAAPASAPSSRSTPSCSSPTTTCRWPTAPSPPGRRAPARPTTSCASSPRSARTSVLHGHAVEGAAGAGQGGPALRRELQGPRQVPQPLRPRPLLHDRVRGRRPVRQAPARRDRLRLEPGALRGLHAGGALPAVQGRPAQAGDPRRAHRRQEHLRDLRPGHQRGGRVPRRRRLLGARAADRRAGHQGDRGPARASCSTSVSTTCPSTGRPARCPAARRSGSGWPRRSAPAWSACSTSSTSRPSACTSATTTGSSRR